MLSNASYQVQDEIRINMNSKRAKAIKRLANECGIGYRPMKKQYNRFARQSEQENKLYENKFNSSVKEQTPTSSSDTKSVEE